MATFDRRILSRTLVAGLVVAAIGLSGCGRRGVLEPPPGASVAAPGQKAPDPGPQKPDKPFFLDWLL